MLKGAQKLMPTPYIKARKRQMNDTGPSEWDFLEEFHQRDEQSQERIAKLNRVVTTLTAALHHAGFIAQCDRIALNRSQEHLSELQREYEALKLASERSGNDLHAEREKHQLCRETLIHERTRQEETEKTLRCVWDANSRLTEILSNARELEAKANKILDLELSIIRSQQIEDLG